MRVSHPIFTVLLVIFLLIYFLYLAIEFVGVNIKNSRLLEIEWFKKIFTFYRWFYYLILSFIFCIFIFYIFSTFSLWQRSIKVIVEYKGKKESYLVDNNTPLWILKDKAREKYYGHNLFVKTNLPRDREYIAYIGLDQIEYDESLLRYLGLKLHLERKPGIVPKLFVILSLFVLWITILPSNTKFFRYIKAIMPEHKELSLIKRILVILLSFYTVVISYNIFFFKLSLLRIILYLSPILFYFVSLSLAHIIRERLEFDLTYRAGGGLFRKVVLSVLFLFLFSIIAQKIHIFPSRVNEFATRLYQPSVLGIFFAASGIYWHTAVERRKLYEFVVWGTSLLAGVVVLTLVKDFGILVSFFWAALFQFFLAFYSANSYNKRRWIPSVLGLLFLLLSILAGRYLFPRISKIPLVSSFIPPVPYTRIAILTTPFSSPHFQQLAFYNYLILEGLYLGRGFFSMLPHPGKIPLLRYIHTDHPYAILAYCGGVPLLCIFYLYKFFLYAVIAYLIHVQVPFERYRRLSLTIYPILFIFLIFDLFSILGTLRIITFTGVPTVFLSYAFSLTGFLLFVIAPVFTLREKKDENF